MLFGFTVTTVWMVLHITALFQVDNLRDNQSHKSYINICDSPTVTLFSQVLQENVEEKEILVSTST